MKSDPTVFTDEHILFSWGWSALARFISYVWCVKPCLRTWQVYWYCISLYPNGHLHFVLFLLFPVFNQFKHNRKTESKLFEFWKGLGKLVANWGNTRKSICTVMGKINKYRRKIKNTLFSWEIRVKKIVKFSCAWYMKPCINPINLQLRDRVSLWMFHSSFHLLRAHFWYKWYKIMQIATIKINLS